MMSPHTTTRSGCTRQAGGRPAFCAASDTRMESEKREGVHLLQDSIGFILTAAGRSIRMFPVF